MKNTILLIPMLLSYLILEMQEVALAQDGGRWIRVEDFCRVVSEELKRDLANPLYVKALADKRAGKRLLPRQKYRLESVELSRLGLRRGKCK